MFRFQGKQTNVRVWEERDRAKPWKHFFSTTSTSLDIDAECSVRTTGVIKRA